MYDDTPTASLPSLTYDGARLLLEKPNSNLILQVLQVTPITPAKKAASSTTTGSLTRYKIRLSDGIHYAEAIAASSIAEIASSLLPLSLVNIREYICNTVNSKNIAIILQAQPINEGKSTTKIGDPSPLNLHEVASNLQQAPSPSSKLQEQDSAPMHSHISQPHHVVQDEITTISQLNPYRARWSIKAKVTHKSAIKSWNKAGRQGKLFTADLMDQTVCFLRLESLKFPGRNPGCCFWG